MVIIRVMSPCNHVGGQQRFGRTCYRHLQSRFFQNNVFIKYLNVTGINYSNILRYYLTWTFVNYSVTWWDLWYNKYEHSNDFILWLSCGHIRVVSVQSIDLSYLQFRMFLEIFFVHRISVQSLWLIPCHLLKNLTYSLFIITIGSHSTL